MRRNALRDRKAFRVLLQTLDTEQLGADRWLEQPRPARLPVPKAWRIQMIKPLRE
jgi:hypothetical protein